MSRTGIDNQAQLRATVNAAIRGNVDVSMTIWGDAQISPAVARSLAASLRPWATCRNKTRAVA
jgi:hypothetical protein